MDAMEQAEVEEDIQQTNISLCTNTTHTESYANDCILAYIHQYSKGICVHNAIGNFLTNS